MQIYIEFRLGIDDIAEPCTSQYDEVVAGRQTENDHASDEENEKKLLNKSINNNLFKHILTRPRKVLWPFPNIVFDGLICTFTNVIT